VATIRKGKARRGSGKEGRGRDEFQSTVSAIHFKRFSLMQDELRGHKNLSGEKGL
jgi:hypothetical protein